MCKKLAVLLLMVSICSYALALPPIVHDDTDDVVISSFEGTMDGWVVQGTGNSATLGGTYGATDGFYSLALSTPNSWWNEAMYIDLGAIEGGSDAVFGNNTLSFDISWSAAENTGPGQGWAQNPLIKLLVNPSNFGVNGLNWWQSDAQGINTGGYDYTYNGYVGNDGSATLSYNYQTMTGGFMNSTSTTLKFILEFVHVIGDASVFHIDNVRLSGPGYVEVPEPMTIALLGLGSVALLRRRK